MVLIVEAIEREVAKGIPLDVAFENFYAICRPRKADGIRRLETCLPDLQGEQKVITKTVGAWGYA